MRGFVGLFSIFVVAVVVLIVVDVIVRPTPSQDACALDRQLLLPDSCAGNCDPGEVCLAATTRPYGFFLEQAASCVELCSVTVD